jgi:hypothetical protein
MNCSHVRFRHGKLPWCAGHAAVSAFDSDQRVGGWNSSNSRLFPPINLNAKDLYARFFKLKRFDPQSFSTNSHHYRFPAK